MKQIIILVIFFWKFTAFAFQTELKETKYIYALDITLSMWGFGDNPDIFDEVREELINSIKAIESPKSEIVLYTFQDEIIDTLIVTANEKGKDELIEKLNTINRNNVPKQNTNIYKAWVSGKTYVDPSKINVFFLLTDGNHTVKHTPKSKLYEAVEDWNINQQDIYSFAFLIELTEKAKDNNLRNIVEKTNNAQVITGIRFNVLDIENKIPTVNINDELSFNFNLIANTTHNFNKSIQFTIKSNHEDFKILNGENLSFNSLPIKLILKPTKDIELLKRELDQKVILEAIITYDEEAFSDTKLLMKQFKINLVNKKEKVLRVEVN